MSIYMSQFLGATTWYLPIVNYIKVKVFSKCHIITIIIIIG